MLKGLAISPGYAIGRAHCLKHFQFDNIPAREIPVGEIDREISRFVVALDSSRQELSQLLDLPQIKSSLEIANIFGAHLGLIDDPDLRKEVTKRIRERRLNLEATLSGVIKEYSQFFKSLPDPQFQEKAVDIMDIGRRILKNCMTPNPMHTDSPLREGVILIAEDLTATDIVGLDPSKILGIVMAEGTATSHASILARSLAIPALVQVKSLLDQVAQGSFLIIDGNTGTLVVNPQPHLVEEYQKTSQRFEEKRLVLEKELSLPSISLDGERIILCANIGAAQDVDKVIANKADGIGLYRTEFTYLIRRRFPTEEELIEIYTSVMTRLGESDVVIRTIDLGGDKISHLVNQPIEKNPELGWRAVRLSLDRLDIFRTQLRAILRTAAILDRKQTKILFPMISNLGELRRLRAFLNEVCEELKKEGVSIPSRILVGAMIEVPSAAILADKIAREVDFLSIGSNDLVQYTLAVDRTNSKVAHLYQPTSPAVLRLLYQVIQAADRAGKPVSICGELAGDSRYTLLLIGLGMRELSMNSVFIPRVKQVVRLISTQEARKAVLPLIEMDTAEEIEKELSALNSRLGIH